MFKNQLYFLDNLIGEEDTVLTEFEAPAENTPAQEAIAVLVTA